MCIFSPLYGNILHLKWKGNFSALRLKIANRRKISFFSGFTFDSFHNWYCFRRAPTVHQELWERQIHPVLGIPAKWTLSQGLLKFERVWVKTDHPPSTADIKPQNCHKFQTQSPKENERAIAVFLVLNLQVHLCEIIKKGLVYTVHPCVNCAVKFEPHMKKSEICGQNGEKVMQVWL